MSLRPNSRVPTVESQRGKSDCRREYVAISAEENSVGGSEPSVPEPDADELDGLATEIILVRLVRGMRQLRRVGRAQLGRAFSEPALDMLLEVYYRESTGEATTRKLLREVTDAPPSVADRWLCYLRDEQFVRTSDHPTCPEIQFVELTDGTRQALECFFVEVRAIALRQGEGVQLQMP